MFEITVRIDREEDLYCSFDDEGLTLNDDLIGYIVKALEGLDAKEQVRLKFVSRLDIDENRLERALRKHNDSVGQSVRREKKGNLFNSLRLLFIGVAFIVIGIAFEGRVGPVAAAIISTIGSFSVWEAANVWIQKFHAIRTKQKALNFLSKSEIVIEDAG